MAKEYSNEGRVALFPNDKGDNAKRPDWRGTLQLDGVAYKLSLWDKTGPKGPYKAGQIEVDNRAPQGTQSHTSAPARTETRTFTKPAPTERQIANQDPSGATDEDAPPF